MPRRYAGADIGRRQLGRFSLPDPVANTPNCRYAEIGE
jgi:hypothetical protein